MAKGLVTAQTFVLHTFKLGSALHFLQLHECNRFQIHTHTHTFKMTNLIIQTICYMEMRLKKKRVHESCVPIINTGVLRL